MVAEEKAFGGLQWNAVIHTALVCPTEVPLMDCAWQGYDFTSLVATTDMMLMLSNGTGAAFRSCSVVSAAFCAGAGNNTLGDQQQSHAAHQ